MYSSATLSSPDLSRSSQISTMGFIGVFGLCGAAFVALQPGAIVSLSIIMLVSLTVAALAVSASVDGEDFGARRGHIRKLSSVLMAALLWLAILAGTTLAGGQGALAVALSLGLFAAFALAEAALSAVVSLLMSPAADADPAIAVAIQVSDKYAGLAGELN